MDPVTPVSLYDLCPSEWHYPTISSRKYAFFRIMCFIIALLQLIHELFVFTAHASIDFSDNHFLDEFYKQHIAIPAHIISPTANLVMPVQTLLTCLVGVDKLYMVHLLLFGAESVTSCSWRWLDLICLPKKSAYEWFMKSSGVLNNTFGTFAKCYWNLLTRFMYLTLYRKTVEANDEIPNNSILNYLGYPILILIVLRLMLLVIPLITMNGTKNWLDSWWRHGGLGKSFVNETFNTAWFTYELYMFAVLDAAKRNFLRYFTVCQPTNWKEKAYITFVYLVLIKAIYWCVFANLSNDVTTEAWFQWFKDFQQVFYDVVQNIRYPLLWYIACEMLGVWSLPPCQFEIELWKNHTETLKEKP